MRSDVLITIGGTGRGSKDLTRRAILEAGGKLLDSQEADRCSGGASPFIAGELDGRPVIGLPGNPLAAMMIAQRVVLPLIAARSGIALHEKVVRAAFSGNIPAGKTGGLCVSLCGCGDARIARAVQKGTGSVLLLRDAAGVVKVGKDGIRTQDAGPEAPQRAFPHRSPPADGVLKPILHRCSSCIWFCRRVRCRMNAIY